MLKFVSVLALGLALSTGAAAQSTYSNQKITQIAAGGVYAGDVVLRLSGHGTLSPPPCHNDNHWSLRFDATTEAGKQALSMAVLAQSTGLSVDIAGENTCVGGAQQLRWIRLK